MNNQSSDPLENTMIRRPKPAQASQPPAAPLADPEPDRPDDRAEVDLDDRAAIDLDDRAEIDLDDRAEIDLDDRAEIDLVEPVRPLRDDAAPEEISAAAERMRRQAGAGYEAASQDRAEADRIMTTAQAEAARILADATAEATGLRTAADRRQRDADDVALRANWLDNGARMQAEDQARKAGVTALEAERDETQAQIAALDGQLARLREQEADAGRELACALATDDDGTEAAVTEAQSRQSTRQLRIAASARQRQAKTVRLAEIDDELTQARRRAGSGIRNLLNQVWPQRPEAVADASKARDEQRRIREAEERAAAPRNVRQTFTVR